MTLNYIVNSSGIPATTLMAGLKLPQPIGPAHVSLHQPLANVAAELRYPGGPRGLCDDLQAVITGHARDEP